jgi:dihydrofolate reductase
MISVSDITCVVAMDQHGLIGRQGTLPWHLPGDLRRFRQLTLGHTLVMGRKTLESIGRCLPGRHTIVITRQSNYPGLGATIATDWERAKQLAPPEQRLFVVGGAEIYRLAWPDVTHLHITIVEGDFQGDTYFPHPDWRDWHVTHSQSFPTDAHHPFACRVLECVRTSTLQDQPLS